MSNYNGPPNPPEDELSKRTRIARAEKRILELAAAAGVGAVTSVTGSGNIASSGGATPNITFVGILPSTQGGTGTASPGLIAGPNITISGAWPNQTIGVASPLPVANGGTGTATPSLVAGTNITSITGSWPNQTINASAGTGLASGWFNVKDPAYGAKGDGATDDKAAIQSAISAAAAAGGGIVFFPPGNYMLSGGLYLYQNYVRLQGSGRFQSMIKALASFTVNADANPGLNGTGTGLINLDGPNATKPFLASIGVSIGDLGFDPRNATNTYGGALGTFGQLPFCIWETERPLQHARFERLWFELGGNPTDRRGIDGGPKGFGAIGMYALGGSISVQGAPFTSTNWTYYSHDIIVRDIIVHNGNSGTCQVHGGPYQDLTVEDISTYVDMQYIDDDRVFIGGGSGGVGGPWDVKNITCRNHRVIIRDNVTTGGSNLCTFGTGSNTYLSNILFDGGYYQGSPNGDYVIGPRNGSGYGVSCTTNGAVSGVSIRNVTIRNLFGKWCGGLAGVTYNLEGSYLDTLIVLENIVSENDLTRGAVINVAPLNNPTGKETIVIRNFKVESDPIATTGGTSYGVLLQTGGTSGASGTTVIENGYCKGFTYPVVITTPWDNVEVNNVKWDTGTLTANNAGYKNYNLRDTSLNTKGLIGAQPTQSLQPGVPGSTVEQRNPYLFPVFVCVAGGTVSNISIGPSGSAGTATGLTSGMVRLASNESIRVTYTVAPTWTWFGSG